jgi:hypothetical protein
MEEIKVTHDVLMSLEEALEVWANDIDLAQKGWRDTHRGVAAATLAVYASRVPGLEKELEQVKKELTGARLQGKRSRLKRADPCESEGEERWKMIAKRCSKRS